MLVIGGSFAYTGAPFYAGIAALKTGADLVYVACTQDAAVPIKSYSPELIVQPVLRSSRDIKDGLSSSAAEEAVNKSVAELKPMIARVQSAIIGPGLGMDPLTHRIVERAIEELKQQGKPTVFDADSLSLIAAKPTLLVQHPAAILTPNAAEFSRLWESLHFHHPRGWEADNVPPVPEDPLVAAGQLMALLQTICTTFLADSAPETLERLHANNQLSTYTGVLKKGSSDVTVATYSPPSPSPSSSGASFIAADGGVSSETDAETESVVFNVAGQEGSPRRSGGQGDVLSGVLGTFLAWRHASASSSSSSSSSSPSRGEGWFGNPYPSSPPTKPQRSIVVAGIEPGKILPVGASLIPRESLVTEEEGSRYASFRSSAGLPAAASDGSSSSSSHKAAAEEAPPRLQALVACGGAAAKLVRSAAQAAFKEHGRSTTTPDVIAKIGPVFDGAFPGTL